VRSQTPRLKQGTPHPRSFPPRPRSDSRPEPRKSGRGELKYAVPNAAFWRHEREAIKSNAHFLMFCLSFEQPAKLFSLHSQCNATC
jgi:hypothetical protein